VKAVSSKEVEMTPCCVSVIMRPWGYFMNPHLALGAIWSWVPYFSRIWSKQCRLPIAHVWSTVVYMGVGRIFSRWAL